MEIKIIIIIFLLILLSIVGFVERKFKSKWLPKYFLYGLTLFQKKYALKQKVDIDFDILSREKGRINDLRIVFKRFGENMIFFREQFWQIKFRKYFPIMHGNISIQENNLMIVGKADIYPLFFCFIAFLSYPIFGVLILAYLLWNYLLQKYSYEFIGYELTKSES